MTTTFLRQELLTQPDDWAAVPGELQAAAALLPRDGERVAVIGCGTSWFMGQSYAALRETRGQGWTDAFAASEHRLDRDYDRVVIICRSGTTTEVREVVEHLHRRGVPHVAIVATPGTPVAERAQSTILLDRVDERSVVQTRFATTALALLRASLGDDLSGAIADARAALAEPESSLDALAGAEQITFVGRDWTNGLVQEAALKLRESNLFWSEAYPAMEYRHGPISIAAPGRVVWAFGEVPDGLADEVRATGAHFEHREADGLAELVRVHRLAEYRARRNGLDPDNPRNLTRSIVLT